MAKEQELAKLESIIENLLLRFNVLKQEKIELTAQLQAKEDKIVELQEKIESLADDKSEVKGRVSSLIDSIEDWERTFFTEEQTVDENMTTSEHASANISEPSEPQLFSVGE